MTFIISIQIGIISQSEICGGRGKLYQSNTQKKNLSEGGVRGSALIPTVRQSLLLYKEKKTKQMKCVQVYKNFQFNFLLLILIFW